MPNPIGQRYMGVNPVANALEPPIQVLLNLMQQQAKRNDLLEKILQKTKETKVDPFELEKLKQKHRLELLANKPKVGSKQFAPQRPSYDPRVVELQKELGAWDLDITDLESQKAVAEAEATKPRHWWQKKDTVAEAEAEAFNTRLEKAKSKREEIARALSAALIEQGRASKQAVEWTPYPAPYGEEEIPETGTVQNTEFNDENDPEHLFH